MYESRNEPPISQARFFNRIAKHIVVSLLVVLCSLGIGVLGLIYFEDYSPYKSILHSATVLSGLGIIEVPKTTTGKLFLSLYTLYAGLIFLITASIVIAPAIHRLMHIFHWEGKN